MQDKKGLVALLLNGVVLGTYGVWVRLLQHTFTGYQQVAARSIVSFLIALLMLFVLHGTWQIQKKHTKHLSFYLLCFALSTILFTLAAIQTTIALSVFGLYVGSILTAFVLGFFFFNEKLTSGKILSIIFIITALLAFTYPFSLKEINFGFFIGIASGIFDGIGNAFKKYFKGKIQTPLLIVLQLFSTLIVALFLAITSSQVLPIQHVSNTIWLVVVLYGVFFVTSSYLSLFGFQHFNLNLGTIIISSELFFAPFFAFLFFKETLTVYEVIGGILLAAAIVSPYIKIKSIKKVFAFSKFIN